jgi:hypothetical protein
MLPPKTGKPPQYSKLWIEQPDKYEHPEFDWILRKVHDFRARGMTAESIAYSWIRRVIQPLQQRKNPGWMYTGTEDPTRMLKTELTHEEIMGRMKKFLIPSCSRPALFEEFSAELPSHRVSTSSTSPIHAV